MNDLCWNSKLLGAMKEHACLTEEEIIVLIDWVDNHWSIAKTGIERSMSDSKVEKIRHRLRVKYDGIQKYVEDLPPRECRKKPRKCKNPPP